MRTALNIKPEKFEFSPRHDIRNRHGAPGWFELATSDPTNAAAFLGRLYGWSFVEIEMAGAPYLVIQVEGHEVGGIRKKMAGEPDAPQWTTYVTVDDIDRFAANARKLGAEIAIPPMDLGGAGRMAMIAQPDCGTLAVFQYSRPFS